MSKSLLWKILNYFDPPEEKDEFMECTDPQSVVIHLTEEDIKVTYREPVQSLLDSIERGDWYIYSSWESKDRSSNSTYTLSHTSLDIQFSIIHEALYVYGASIAVDYYYGEEWLSRSERKAVYSAISDFYADLNKAFSDARNKVREQEFMQLTKEK